MGKKLSEEASLSHKNDHFFRRVSELQMREHLEEMFEDLKVVAKDTTAEGYRLDTLGWSIRVQEVDGGCWVKFSPLWVNNARKAKRNYRFLRDNIFDL